MYSELIFFVDDVIVSRDNCLNFENIGISDEDPPPRRTTNAL